MGYQNESLATWVRRSTSVIAQNLAKPMAGLLNVLLITENCSRIGQVGTSHIRDFTN